MLGATNLNQFPWFIMAVPNIFMVFHKAIFVLRVLVNQDKNLWILLHFYLPDLPDILVFCSEISLLSAVFCTSIQECWRDKLVIVLIHKVRQELWRIDYTGIDWAHWEPIDFSK